MKIRFGVIGVFLCTLLYSTPIFTVFVPNYNYKFDHVSFQNVRGFRAGFGRQGGFRAIQRRHFAGSRQVNSDNIVDSHFQVLKMDTNPRILSPEKDKQPVYKASPTVWNTEAPKNHARKDNFNSSLGKKPKQNNFQNIQDRPKNTRRSQPEKTKPSLRANQQLPLPLVNLDIMYQALPRNYQAKHYVKETKPNFVKVNINKMPISTVPQRVVNLNINHQIAAVPIHRPDNIRQKKDNTVESEKNVQMVPTKSDRNSKMPIQNHTETEARQLAPIPPKPKPNQSEYKKRDTDYSYYYEITKAKRNVISDTMKKYIVNKDKIINMERKGNKEYSRIGISDDSVQAGDNPYAIFYKMHPDTLNELDGYVPSWSDGRNDNILSPGKKKKLLVTFANDIVDFRNSLPIKNNFRKVKLHKKMRNFGNHHSIPSAVPSAPESV